MTAAAESAVNAAQQSFRTLQQARPARNRAGRSSCCRTHPKQRRTIRQAEGGLPEPALTRQQSDARSLRSPAGTRAMVVIETLIPDVKLIRLARHHDARGYFAETYSARALAEAGITCRFVQDNHSFSVHAGTVRGLHLQLAPHAQDKLVRVVRGSIMDVALDVRPGSPSFGRHVTATLSAAEPAALFIPKGFAHGFCTLEPDTEVAYKTSAFYAPSHDRGVLWNDPDLGIDWPVTPARAVLSERDRQHPRLR
jgi:dTDP-4-dehydrorhamnose 3,5-epimerase